MENIEKIVSSLRNIEGLDVEQGILYCNGEETYIEILRAYCEDWESGVDMADSLYAVENWKDYTIAVHGLKSALFSIGVSGLSEMAKQLEFAGKENRISYITENHSHFVESYRTFFAGLIKNEWLCPDEEENTGFAGNDNEISSEQFAGILSDMEAAMYSFDVELMLKFIENLEQYSYKGNVLRNVLTPVRRKIEMSDLFSAVDMLAGQKRDMDGC